MKEIVFEITKVGNKNIRLLSELVEAIAAFAKKNNGRFHLKIIVGQRNVTVAVITKEGSEKLNFVSTFAEIGGMIEKIKNYKVLPKKEEAVEVDGDDFAPPEVPDERQELEKKTKKELSEMFGFSATMSKTAMIEKALNG